MIRVERMYRTWDQWECYPAGFYETRPPAGMTPVECEATYRDLLRDLPAFRAALARVLAEWPRSCEHYLSNENMNRIAWLGQAALCIARGIPSCFRGGFNLLTADEQAAANDAALDALNTWLAQHHEGPLTHETAKSKTQMDLY